ncbi:MAG: hypothetical protein ABIJ05_04525 [Patescibacteria group bacterium]
MKETDQNFMERNQSWEEIFPSEEERKNQFKDLLDELKNEYVSNNTFKSMEEVVEGKIQRNVINKTNGGKVIASTLENGNVELTFINHGSKNTGTITPDVGIKDVRWTHKAIKYLRKGLDIYRAKKHTSFKAGQLALYAKGKPATKGWEDVMRFNGHTPIRVGFKIYPNEILRDASILLKENRI